MAYIFWVALYWCLSEDALWCHFYRFVLLLLSLKWRGVYFLIGKPCFQINNKKNY